MLYRETTRLGIWGSVIALVCFAVPAGADTITIKDVKYENVLVSKTNSLYYVRIPAEGRVISVAKDQVDPATVTISDDPYYRDNLKTQYEEARKNISEGISVSNGQNFAVATDQSSGGGGGGSFLDSGGGGATAKSLGVTRTSVKEALEQAGFTFSGQGMVVQGSSAKGDMTVQLHGSDEDLTAIIATATSMAQMGLLQSMGNLAPALGGISRLQWFGPWIQQNMQQLMTSNAISNTAQGVFVAMEPGQTANGVQMKITIQGV